MFWENFDYLCRKIGKYPNTVAAEIGIKSTGTVSGWKDGKLPHAKTQQKIADYFGITVEELNGDFIPAKQKRPPDDADAALKFALWGDDSSDMDDGDLDDVRRYAAFLKERKGKK